MNSLEFPWNKSGNRFVETLSTEYLSYEDFNFETKKGVLINEHRDIENAPF